MAYLIEPKIDPSATREDLAAVSLEEVDAAEAYFDSEDITSSVNISVKFATLYFENGGSHEVTDYKGLVASEFRANGDRHFITYDGGMVNVSAMFKLLREAVEDARSGSEPSGD